MYNKCLVCEFKIDRCYHLYSDGKILLFDYNANIFLFLIKSVVRFLQNISDTNLYALEIAQSKIGGVKHTPIEKPVAGKNSLTG